MWFPMLVWARAVSMFIHSVCSSMAAVQMLTKSCYHVTKQGTAQRNGEMESLIKLGYFGQVH